MTQTTIRTRVSILARISASVRRHQHKLSGRIHAAADEQARQHGWTVIKTPGRFGFESRSYRDPRFDDRRRQTSQRTGRRHTGSEAAPMSKAGE
jgi:hypothetical protein